jgi:hypothetical protein
MRWDTDFTIGDIAQSLTVSTLGQFSRQNVAKATPSNLHFLKMPHLESHPDLFHRLLANLLKKSSSWGTKLCYYILLLGLIQHFETQTATLLDPYWLFWLSTAARSGIPDILPRCWLKQSRLPFPETCHSFGPIKNVFPKMIRPIFKSSAIQPCHLQSGEV